VALGRVDICGTADEVMILAVGETAGVDVSFRDVSVSIVKLSGVDVDAVSSVSFVNCVDVLSPKTPPISLSSSSAALIQHNHLISLCLNRDRAPRFITCITGHFSSPSDD